MNETVNRAVGSRVLLTIACLIILVAGLRAAEPVIVPFLLSVFLGMMGVPILVSLCKWGVPRPLAILTVVLALVVVLVVLGLVIGSSVSALTGAMPSYQARMIQFIASAEGRLVLVGIELPTPTELGEVINFGQVVDWTTGLLARLASLVSDFLLVVVTTIFILLEATGFSTKVRVALGRAEGEPLPLGRVMSQVHRYLIIKTAVSFATGLLLGLWVWALGVDFPVVWGLFAFLLNYIPNIGSIIAAVPPVLVGLIQPGGGVPVALAVAAGFLAVNIVVGNFMEPRLMGERLGLSTLVVFLSLVFWGWVWGGVGMLLAVPLTMVVKILFQNSEELRWVAVLLDNAPAASDLPPARI